MSYADKSRIRDFDQHAAKIRLGLQNLTNDDAQRAIWELFQNAVDLSSICKIRVTRTEKGLKFEHNGKPFDEDSLACLIKQVSNKDQGTSAEQVGQYGSGFITTHIYGKVIEVNGYVEVEDGYIPIDNFILDRKEEENKSLREKVIDQDELAAKIISTALGKVEHLNDSSWTCFHYIAENETHFHNIDSALAYLEDIVPLVFVFNDRLSFVELSIPTKVIKYKREKVILNDGYEVVKILKENEVISFICLFSKDADRSIRVILPYDEQLESKNAFEAYPKLFLFYPLIGTENNGINIIIHSHNFSPKEKRDSLFLSFENEDITKDVETNQKILIQSLDIILEFVKKNAKFLQNTLSIANVFLKERHDVVITDLDFWESQKIRFVDELLGIELLDTNSGRIAISEAFFFDTDLLIDFEYNKAIYAVANQFWNNIPMLTEVVAWSKLTKSWDNEKIKFIGIKDLLKQVHFIAYLKEIKEKDNYRHFIEYVFKYSRVEYFEEYAVLPNIYGSLLPFSSLKEPELIDPILIQVAEVLFENIPSSFVDPKYILGRVFPKYQRESFKKDINQKAGELSDALGKGENVIFDEIIALLEYSNINTTTEINKAFCYKLSGFYEIKLTNNIVDNHVKDFDYRQALKAIFRYFISDISQKGIEWLKVNIKHLSDALEIVYQNDDFKKTLLHEIKAYPNQNYILCSQNDIKVDVGIPEKLKSIYYDVMQIDIKQDLALFEISQFLNNPSDIKPEQLGQELEKSFNNDLIKYTPITSHKHKDLIISIVELIISEGSQWKIWFPVLNSIKLEVLVGKIIDPTIRSSMFSILTQTDKKIELLGQLAEIENLDEIIKAGQKKIEEDKHKRSDFKHKYIIGTLIEKIIRERLSSSIAIRIEKPTETELDINDITTFDEQNGQDIVIYLNESPIYLIEVKSRWNENTPFRISRNQTIRAFDNLNKYALVSVDMTNYIGDNKHNVKDIQEIRDVIRVNSDIGSKLASGLVDLYKNSGDATVFHLDGDFRTFIPLSYIKSGKSLNEFEDFLIIELQKAYDKQN